MGPISTHAMGRRSFLTLTGRGVVGFAVLGLAACSGAQDGAGDGSTPAGSPTPEGDADDLAWSRVNLGFVSAYVLVRGREAAVVDTGADGSADAIGSVLGDAGPGWAGVRHVVLTHKHGDHVGSVGEVLTRATNATGYVGTADLPDVDAAGLQTLGDGDDVLGLQVVATPGHTAGHLAVYDSGTGVLVAGDALTNTDGLTGSLPQFTEDEAAAAESVRKLAQLSPSTILVGHGDPLLEDASAALADLAASLA